MKESPESDPCTNSQVPSDSWRATQVEGAEVRVHVVVIDIAGVVSYVVDEVSAPKQYIAPDKYFTLGDVDELLGPVIPGQEATTGFVIGDPNTA